MEELLTNQLVLSGWGGNEVSVKVDKVCYEFSNLESIEIRLSPQKLHVPR